MIGRLREWFRKHPAPEPDQPSEKRLSQLKENLGISIPDEDLHFFLKALRHRSIVDNSRYESHETYERLEFLGDAVLDLIVTEILFEKYPTEDEGFLTKLRAKIVKGDTLNRLARSLELNKALEIGDRASGQGVELSKSVMADVYEAIIAAIYLSRGYEYTFRFVERNIEEFLDLKKIETKVDNFKSVLMEHTQAKKISLPEYRVILEEGPGHDKTFLVAVFVDNKEAGRGEGKSKKQAEQLAAMNALEKLRVTDS
jgi:ribonuclease-3